MNILLESISSHADPSQVAGLSRFFKTGPGQYGEGDKFLGIKVPVTRAVVKDCWRQLGTPWDGHSEGFPELEACMASEYHEVRLAALLALVEIFKHAGKAASVKSGKKNPSSSPAPTGLPQQQCIDFYLSHTAGINNWDLVDLSCYPLLGEWLLDKDRSLLYDLARHGHTLWEQRIGIVSTMSFIRHGQLLDTFDIADILLHHPHDLIHKAVGWLLREAGKRDKFALEAYLQGPDPSVKPARSVEPDPTVIPVPSSSFAGLTGESPRYRTMPRTALRYAIERFPEAERQSYLSGHAH